MKNYFIPFLLLLGAWSISPALQAQTFETHLGENAGDNSKGLENVYIGFHTGEHDNSTQTKPFGQNTFVGALAGIRSTGSFNSIYGLQAGRFNNGTNNVFMGWSAGDRNKGGNNTFIGTEAGRESVGEQNAALGFTSGQTNKGDLNAFGGVRSGFQNVGNRNTAFGFSAGSANLGESNTFLGAQAGGGNNGSFNIGIGERAGFGNDGHFNIAIGYRAGGAHSKADNNTYLGTQAGEKNQTGSNNLYVGFQSGQTATGTSNTFLGAAAGKEATGSKNVFIGFSAGAQEKGSNKLYIANGSNSINNLIYGDFAQKKVAIGGKVDSDYTLHILGDVFSTGNWTSSDKRFKQNIQSIDKPLEKLLAVKGVSYEFKKDSVRAFHQGKSYGFIAQDVQKVLPAVVQADKQGYLAVNYECFIPLLVEALKQQEITHQQKVNQLESQLSELQKLVISSLRVKSTADHSFSNQLESIVLHQNTPNPFHQTTTIRYEAPATSQQIALLVFDLNGQPQLQLNNLSAGKGQVIIQAGQLKPGMYLYSLLVDGKIQDTKRMILTQ